MLAWPFGVIGNYFAPGSEGQKIQSLSVYPWADGKLVKFLLACLERHLILACCILLNNGIKRICYGFTEFI